MGMPTEKHCTKSKLDISNLQCSNLARPLQVLLFLRVSTWQYCCLPSQAMRCYDSNASERCCLKMYKIKMMKSLMFFESCLFSVWIAFWPSLVTLRALPCACMTAVILFPKEHTSKKSTKDLKEGWRLTSSCSPFHYTWAAGQSNMFTRILDRGLISQIMLAFP